MTVSKKIFYIKILDATIIHGISSIGKLSYGYSMDGRLIFDPNDVNNRYGCKKFTKFANENPLVGESPFFMIYKGNCNLIEKIHNIEEAGGHLAIIIGEENETNIENYFFADEVSNSDVSIPAILISRKNGQKLIDYYENNKNNQILIKNIRLELKFDDVEKKSNLVKYDIWYTPDQEKVYNFFKNFKKFHIALEENAILAIRSFTYPHFNYDISNNKEQKNCLSSGAYCYFPSNNYIEDGAKILIESLRQRCIYYFMIAHDSKKKYKYSFWNYMGKYFDECVSKNDYEKSCGDNVMKNLGISFDYVEDCIKYSVECSDDNKDKEGNYLRLFPNSILERDYELRKQSFITKAPIITINERLFIGEWNDKEIFESLCSALIEKPKACLESGFYETSGFSFFSFFIFILLILLVNIGVFFICKSIIKKIIKEKVGEVNMDSEINSAVDNYFALKNKTSEDDK